MQHSDLLPGSRSELLDLAKLSESFLAKILTILLIYTCLSLFDLILFRYTNENSDQVLRDKLKIEKKRKLLPKYSL